MTDMTVFDHRASIVAFLTAKATALDVDRAAAEIEYDETDCHEAMEAIEHYRRQASLVRFLAQQVTRGDDLPAPISAACVATSSPLPPLRTVGPNRGAQ